MNFINYKPQKHFVHLLKHYKFPFTLKTKIESSDVYLQFPVVVALLSLKSGYVIPSNICVIGAVEPDGTLSSPVDILMRIHRAIDYRFNEFFLPAQSERMLLDTGSFPQDVVFHYFDTVFEFEEWIEKQGRSNNENSKVIS
jgi:predicted ATP-dependent serine protease